MVEIGRGLGFGMKAAHVISRGKLSGENHLQRHDPIDTELTSPEDDTHPTPGDLFQQLIVAEIPYPGIDSDGSLDSSRGEKARRRLGLNGFGAASSF